MSVDILVDALSRARDGISAVLEGADPAEVTWRPDPEANTIAWLAWHLARVPDACVAAMAGEPQVWDDWRERFGLPFDADATGYGQTAEEVGQLRVDPALLRGYAAAVFERALAWVGTVTDERLAEVVDDSYDPPVTLAVRLVSIADDCAQHVGQAAYVRGLANRAGVGS